MSLADTRAKPDLMSFTVPMVAAAGAFFGLILGTSQGSGLIGLIAGAAVGAVTAYVLVRFLTPRTGP